MEVGEGKSQPGETTPGSIITQKAADREELEESDPQGSPVASNANNNFQVEGSLCQAPPEVKRPQSASVQYSNPVLSRPRAKVRPRTAASVKAVRFADHTHHSDGTKLPLSKSASWVDEGKGREGGKAEKTKEKKVPGERCKPADADKIRRSGDDEDGEGNSKGGGLSLIHI